MLALKRGQRTGHTDTHPLHGQETRGQTERERGGDRDTQEVETGEDTQRRYRQVKRAGRNAFNGPLRQRQRSSQIN